MIQELRSRNYDREITIWKSRSRNYDPEVSLLFIKILKTLRHFKEWRGNAIVAIDHIAENFSLSFDNLLFFSPNMEKMETFYIMKHGQFQNCWFQFAQTLF